VTDVVADPYGAARAAADAIARVTGALHHDVAVVLGSGWSPALATLGATESAVAMPDVPGFPPPGVEGHPGTIRSHVVGDHRVLVLAGRVHLYEGYDVANVVHGVRTAVRAGARIVMLTNAAGGISRDYRVGQPVLIADHLNLTGQGPTAGSAGGDGRFVDCSDLYAQRLRAVAREVEPSLVEGVYAALRGPHYETPAEIRMLATMGATLVGMSTALEAIAARHLGAEVLGVSLVTNPAAGVTDQLLDHGDVLAAGRAAAADLGTLLARVIAAIPPAPTPPRAT
jgi:purine-nucleoside phosphorylase